MVLQRTIGSDVMTRTYDAKTGQLVSEVLTKE
jgi:hypothetical protein